MTLFVILALVLVAAALPFAIEALRKPMDDSARAAAPGDFVTLSRGITHFQWHGPVRGPVAVCVHGLTTPSYVWQGLVKGLTAMGYRVLTYDLYGRGFSDRPPGPQDAAFFVTQLEELMASQEIAEDITLIGYSMGGSIATSFSARHPDMIRHLVLLAPAGMTRIGAGWSQTLRRVPVVGDWLMLTLFPGMHRKGTESERHLDSSVDNIVDLQQAELRYRGFVPAVLASLRGLLDTDLEEEHRAIHQSAIPVLAIWGRQDDVIPVTASGQLAQWSRDARQEVIDGAGHGLAYTHTDDVLAILSARLRAGLN